jgi:hypothetical protein
MKKSGNENKAENWRERGTKVNWPSKGKPLAAPDKAKDTKNKSKDPVEESLKKVDRPFNGIRPVPYAPLQPGVCFEEKPEDIYCKKGVEPNTESKLAGPAYKSRGPSAGRVRH